AQVAPFHGNFIINTGTATFKDVKALVEHVKSVVKNKYNFILEPEIIFVDNLIN
ncbi:MAG: UDP-N-acetylenolpyruvoylglucosamine reductase, partial [Clostridia bacterium]|nr:UDP-N-acetylenolpyruvoylglucosamine reductase [Clostridia bacterium]